MGTLADMKSDLMISMQEQEPVFIWGPPGVGKTDGVNQVAKSLKYNLMEFMAILKDTVDIRGIPVPDMKTGMTKWLIPSDLPNEKRDGKNGILFMDELNTAHPQVQASLFGLILNGRVGDYVLPKGWRIVAAGNRQEDRAAAQRMPTPLANRLIHLHVEADVDTFVRDFALDHCDERLIAFLRRWKDLLLDMSDPKSVAFPSPRTWAKASKFFKYPKGNRYRLVSGLVGAGAAARVETFLEVYQNLPSMEDIIAKPKTTVVPEDIGARYAITVGCALHSNRDNFDKIMTYIQRYGRDYEIVYTLDATKKDIGLMKTKTYVDFTQRHKDLHLSN